MKRLTLISFILMTFSTSFNAFAQLTEREDNPSLVSTGTRPVQGDFGLLFGPSIVEIEDMFDKNINLRGLPVVKLKYFVANNIEVRLGFQHYKKQQYFEGDPMANQGNWIRSIDNDLKTFNRISPGFAYHFSHRNLLNVYVGMDIPFGSDKYEVGSKFENTDTGAFNDFFERNISKNTSVIGYSFFVGLQAFVADLPFAVGLEYGLSGWKNSGLEYEVEQIERVDGMTTTMNYFTGRNPMDYTNTTQFSDLKYEKYESGANLRITFTYYFMR